MAAATACLPAAGTDSKDFQHPGTVTSSYVIMVVLLAGLAMSERQLKAFLEAVRADAGLQEKLKAATDADAVVAIAKDAGFMISADNLKKAQVALSEEELEGVAGGTSDTAALCIGVTPIVPPIGAAPVAPL